MIRFLKKNNKQLFRFFVTGILASSVNFILYKSLYLFSRNILIASICGYCSGIIVSFIFAKSWGFRKNSNKHLLKSIALFCLIYFIGGMEMSLVIVFINRMIENYEISWLFGAFIGTINNYLGSKYLAFKK